MGEVKVVKKFGGTVDASPSKNFFVEMLTRDIELKDAILDLLDNCLDGALRSLGERSKASYIISDPASQPYKGFHAHIEFNEKHFRITDNCGGMNREILEQHAFRLGRPALERDKDLPTVGLYGIGMKRAIFKMGRSCLVTTRHGNSAHRVQIKPSWLTNDGDWKLDIEEVGLKDVKVGTSIEVQHLRSDVSSEFHRTRNKEFVEDLRTLISTHYSYIIHKGFSVKVNEVPIKPREIYLRYSAKSVKQAKLAPYLFKGEMKGVGIELAVGLYRDVPDAGELEEMDIGGGFRKENAGWTVICNDRVVILNDTTHITGWGEGRVPKYHTQFIAISGVVRFSSSNPKLLPLTTTKRGINLNSPLYAEVKNIMREGLKHFTNFTNKWKSEPIERKELYEDSYPVEPLKAFELIGPKDWSISRKFGGKVFVPSLPIPNESSETKRVIRFTKPASEIARLATFLFNESDISPSIVGERCFNDYYSLATEERDA